MFSFKKSPDPNNDFDFTEVEVSMPSGQTLSDVLETFEAFLKACGYHFDGNVTIEVPFDDSATDSDKYEKERVT